MRRHAKAATAGSNLRRVGAPRLAFLCVPAFLLFALFAASAQAAPETVAEFGEKAGQVRGPEGVALDRASGDLYVADFNNHRIDKFDSDGNFLLAWGFGVADGTTPAPQTCGPEATPPTSRCFNSILASGAGSVFPTGVAVDQSTGAVYVSEGFTRWRVSKFTSSGQFLFMVGRNVNETKVAEGGATQAEKNICTAASGDTCGAGEAGTGPNEFSTPVGEGNVNLGSVAVDSAGVVWVGSLDRLSSFDASGAPGAEIALPGAGLTQSLAFDSADNFYVINQSLPGVRKLEAGTGTLLETLDEAGQPRTVTLDEDDNIYVGDTTSPYRFKVYNPAGEQTAQFGAGQVIGAPGAGNPGGGNALAVDKDTGTLYAASSSSAPAESAVQAFPLPEPGPLVEDQGVEGVEPTTATLTATINPENEQTTYRFEYGSDESYGQSTLAQTLPAEEFEAEDV
ncbi:MAG TPA: NHL repeat-containing protein, partial [Solirubrobacterales bacterium]|nr:NHL repeat-containing protein [Solirubrobacterales bacterium]